MVTPTSRPWSSLQRARELVRAVVDKHEVGQFSWLPEEFAGAAVQAQALQQAVILRESRE